jgi:mono/diheme cytochrome c family protein
MKALSGAMAGAVAIIIGVAASGLLRTQEAPASPAMLTLGDSVFHGKAGAALCYVCHGPAGKGIAGLGPNLADKEWVNGDGSLPFIEKVVLDGVPKPKKMPAPMPPKGGGQLNESQIKAVAAYVYSLSRTTK